MPPCLRVSSLRASDREMMPPCLRVSSLRASDREMLPPCLRNSNLAPTPRVHDASMPARLPQFESRITTHDPRPFRPSLVRGDTPRNAPL